jgi:hypothetical protein
MHTNATKLLAEKTTQNAAPLQIVLIFDHPHFATTTRVMMDGFIRKWVPDVDVHRDEWSFTELEHPKCRSEALELAKNCDMLVIALSESDLPATFMNWLDDWASSRDETEAAVIFLIGSDIADPSAFSRCALLPAFAQKHGLAFFTTVLAPSACRFLPRSLHPKELLSRLAVLDPQHLPDFSGIND